MVTSMFHSSCHQRSPLTSWHWRLGCLPRLPRLGTTAQLQSPRGRPVPDKGTCQAAGWCLQTKQLLLPSPLPQPVYFRDCLYILAALCSACSSSCLRCSSPVTGELACLLRKPALSRHLPSSLFYGSNMRKKSICWVRRAQSTIEEMGTDFPLAKVRAGERTMT